MSPYTTLINVRHLRYNTEGYVVIKRDGIYRSNFREGAATGIPVLSSRVLVLENSQNAGNEAKMHQNPTQPQPTPPSYAHITPTQSSFVLCFVHAIPNNQEIRVQSSAEYQKQLNLNLTNMFCELADRSLGYICNAGDDFYKGICELRINESKHKTNFIYKKTLSQHSLTLCRAPIKSSYGARAEAFPLHAHVHHTI